MYSYVKAVELAQAKDLKPNSELLDGTQYSIDYDGKKARLINGVEIAKIVGENDWTATGNSISIKNAS